MRRMIGGLLTCGASLAPDMSLAQTSAGTSIVIAADLDRLDAAGARIEPGFQPVPLHLGPFAIQPAVSFISGFSSNVFNRRDAQHDASATVIPAVRMRGDFAPYRLDIKAGGTLRRFARFTSENSEEFSVSSEGAFVLANEDQIVTSIGFARLIEPRSSTGTAPDAAEPLSYNRLEGKVGSDLQFGKFRLAPSLAYQGLRYAPLSLRDGSKTDQSFRNAQSIRGDIRISYDFSDMFSAFASGTLSNIRSTYASEDIRRDAQGLGALIGVKGEVTPLLSGEVGIGYQSRRYDLPIYRDFSGITFTADLQWYVTPLTTVRLQAERTFQNSGYREVAGILTDSLTVTAYHDLLRNLRLSLSATLERGRYREVDTRTIRRTLRFNAEYRLNPHLSVGGYISCIDQDVEGAPLVSAFNTATAGIGITVTP